MFVCVCFALNEEDVRDALEDGAETAEDVLGFYGYTINCGICRPFIDKVKKGEKLFEDL